MKKILIVNWRDIKNPEAGGAEMYYHEIFRRITGESISVTILAHSFANAPDNEVVDGINVIRTGNKFLFNFSAMWWLWKHQNEFDLIVEDINKIPFLTPLFVRKKRLHMVMHFFKGSIYKETNILFATYVYLMERMVSLFYKKDTFIAISESTKMDIEKFGIRSNQISIVEPGIDTSYYYQSVEKSTPPTLSYIGRLMKYKNVQFIINALPELRKKVPGVIFEAAGSGDYLEELKKTARRAGVEDCVIFSGRISDQQKRDLLSRSTLFVNPSKKEGWGINNIEANLCGTISLSNNVEGLRDSVQDGVTGLLYESDNHTDFCKKAESVLVDNEMRKKLEKNALQRAKSLDWNEIAQRMKIQILKMLS